MSKRNTKNTPAVVDEDDDLNIPSTPPDFFKGAVVGKYYGKIMSNCDVVRVHADLRAAFPNEHAVNLALRELLKMRETLVNLTADKVKRKKSA